MLVIGAAFADVTGFASARHAPLERNVGDVQAAVGCARISNGAAEGGALWNTAL